MARWCQRRPKRGAVTPTTPRLQDPFGIVGSAVDDPVVVAFDSVDVSLAVKRAKVRSSVGDMARASLVLDATAPVVRDIDFTAEVVVGHGGTAGARRLFTGFVTATVVRHDELTVQCASWPSLEDPMAGATVSRANNLDMLYALMRESGLPDDRICIEGIDRLPTQIFEVVAPVGGLVLSGRVRIGPVTFLPPGAADVTVHALGEHELVAEFCAGGAFAVAHVTASRQFSAESAGLRLIDSGIAWANLRLRYSSGASPSGQYEGWSRVQLRQLASRSDLVAVRGLTTGWSWLRRRRPQSMDEVVLTASGELAAVAALEHSDSESGLRAATVAAARAVSATDPLTRITAVSECLEFYAGSTELEGAFTRRDRKRLLAAARGFPQEKRERVKQLVGDLNKSPLLARVRHRCAVDAVPISNEDMELLKRVRGQRNDLVHGKRDLADDREIDRAVALLARILVYAANAEAGRLRTLI